MSAGDKETKKTNLFCDDCDQAMDQAMSSFKMVDGLPMDHEDHLGEIDGELIVYHSDGTFDFVS